MRAESLPITQETSAESITGRVGQRTKDKNENAGRLERKGKPDRTESRLRVEAIGARLECFANVRGLLL